MRGLDGQARIFIGSSSEGKAAAETTASALELVLRQISEVEAERDEMLRPGQASSPAALLMRLKGIGAEFAGKE